MKLPQLGKNNISRKLHIATALIGSQYALMLEYRAEIILWAISGILPLIMLGIWKEADITSSLGLNSQALDKYFISAFIVRQFTAVWVMVTFEEDNIEGRLSPYLLQPIIPFWRYYSSHVAEQISRLPIVIILLIFLFILMPGSFWLPSFPTILLFIFSTFVAFSVRFLLHWLFAMACFWNDRASAIERLLLIPYLFLSGLVAPIEAFPPTVKGIANLTPFPHILSFPSKLLAGQEVNILESLTALFLWGSVLLLLSYIFWRKGLRKYSGMGS